MRFRRLLDENLKDQHNDVMDLLSDSSFWRDVDQPIWVVNNKIFAAVWVN
jgi:hypothetical protein